MYKILGADQKEYGPITLEQIRQWIVEGRVDRATMVQAQDQISWAPLASIPELAALLPPPPLSGPQIAGARPRVQSDPASPVPYTPHVPSYLLPAILTTLCCCLPFGIVAIVYAAQVNGKLQAGDIAGAQASSRNALMWSWISVAVGVVANGGYLMYFFGKMVDFPR